MNPSKVDVAAKFLIGLTSGFSLFYLTSHPESPLHKKLPKKTVKNVSLVPHIKYQRKDKEIHLHHWVNFAIAYGFIAIKKRHLLKRHAFHGFIVGSILQGLTYKDRFKVIHPRIDH